MFSDLCGLYYGNETEPYYFENLQMYTISLLFSPNKKLKFTMKYNFLRANEQVAPTAALFSGTGKTRGQLPQIRMDYKINNNISFFSSAEYFIPGNFYVSTADDALFLKTQLEIKF